MITVVRARYVWSSESCRSATHGQVDRHPPARRSCSTTDIDYRVPIKFGGRVVADVTLLDVTVDVETRDGRRGHGSGSMPMGNVWAWPSAACPSQRTVARRDGRAGEAIWSRRPDDCRRVGHPLEITHDLAADYRRHGASESCATCSWPSRCRGWPSWWPPARWRPPSTTPTARPWARTAYNLLGREFVNRDLSAYLTDEFAGEYLDRYTLRQPKARMPLYHLVGALDPLTDADIAQRVNDGLPETLPRVDRWPTA